MDINKQIETLVDKLFDLDPEQLEQLDKDCGTFLEAYENMKKYGIELDSDFFEGWLNDELAKLEAQQKAKKPETKKAEEPEPEKPKEPEHDPVNHPSHYTSGGIETIDFIEAKGLGFNLGNVVKYVTRAGKKDDRLEDLKKASWYLNREIKIEETKHA